MSRGSFAAFCALLAAVALGGRVGPVHAQSLLSASGLGYVMEPLDARARGLGGVGLGLADASLSLVNPASVVGLPAPALHVTLQPDQFRTDHGDAEISGSTVRFPVIHVALPYRRWVVSAGYASFLDRNWAVQRDTTFTVDATEVPVRDRFASHGGVGRLRLAGGFAVSQRLGVAAAADIYTGSVQDTVARVFLESPLLPAVSTSELTFSGLGFGAGLRWVPNEALSVATTASAGGRLEIDPGEAGAERRTYDLPLQLAVGASGRVTPTTLVALSGRWSGWSTLDDALADQGGARDAWSLAGGIEWEALRVAERVVPVRIGARQGTLPFRWVGPGAGDGWADERALTLGAGVRLAGGAASIDAAVERGSRGGGESGFSESFWRMAFSLTVLGR